MNHKILALILQARALDMDSVSRVGKSELKQKRVNAGFASAVIRRVKMEEHVIGVELCARRRMFRGGLSGFQLAKFGGVC